MENALWTIITTDCFDRWFDEQNEAIQDTVMANLIRLQQIGYNLARPYADTVYGSQYHNMKELRIQHKGKPIRAFLLLTLYVKLSSFVRAIKVMTKSFMSE